MPSARESEGDPHGMMATSSGASAPSGMMLVEPEDIPDLLSKVAYLIAERATRQVERQLRTVLKN
jgi:hypothetical protein